MSDVVLAVTGLTVAFPGGIEAVRGIEFSVSPGETLAVVGESGSGKSAVALAVMGLLPNSARVSGSVRLQGEEMLTMSDARASELRGNRISMVFQDPYATLTPVYRTGDQIAETLRAHRRISRRAAADRAVELLDVVGVADPRRCARAFPHELSGGLRQRVLVAIAIANNPAVIIADEPTTALDVTVQAQILDVLRTAREVTGAAVVLITHDLAVVAGLADRVQVMYAGRIVESGPVDDIFEQPRMPYTRGLLNAISRLDGDRHRPLIPIAGSPPSAAALPTGCPFRPRCPLATPACAEQEPPLRGLSDVDHRVACFMAEETAATVDADGAADRAADRHPERTAAWLSARPVERVIEVDGLVRRYSQGRTPFRRGPDSVLAVDGITFDVSEGETVAIVGESGCGKTTTLMELMELRRPQHGRIKVFGNDTSDLSVAQRSALRRDLQIVFQDPGGSLDPRMRIAGILAEPLATHGVSRDEHAGRVRELLTLVGLSPEHADLFPHELSGGQRQRAAIARALALRPRLLVLDEPVAALDVSIRAGLINLLAGLRADLGMSYLIVSHDLTTVRHLADRVAVMYRGRIVEIGAADTVFEAPRHPYTQALISAIPVPDPPRERARTRVLLRGESSGSESPPTGCRFRNRCPLYPNLGDHQRRRCREEDPTLPGAGTHRVGCHHPLPMEDH